MTATLAPTTDLVVTRWLKDTVGIANAGAKLPDDQSSWKDEGFVQFLVVAGSPDLYTPIRKPLIQFDFWAISPGSNRAPWGQANGLAETVLSASYQREKFDITVDLGDDYGSARILSTYFIDEPRRIWDQANDSARYMAQMVMNWVHT